MQAEDLRVREELGASGERGEGYVPSMHVVSIKNAAGLGNRSNSMSGNRGLWPEVGAAPPLRRPGKWDELLVWLLQETP